MVNWYNYASKFISFSLSLIIYHHFTLMIKCTISIRAKYDQVILIITLLTFHSLEVRQIKSNMMSMRMTIYSESKVTRVSLQMFVRYK